MSASDNTSLLKFYAPRYWLTWLFYGWMRASVLFPMSWQLAVAKRVGTALGVVLYRKRHVAERNLGVCFPELSEKERTELLRRHFEALGASFAEMAMGWFGPEEKVRALIEVQGAEHLRAALERGKGVILLSAHFTTFELFHPALKNLCPTLCAMFRPQRNEMMNVIMTRGRDRNFDQLFPKDSVRSMIKCLAANAVVWYAPDQASQRKLSSLVPFFGEPAMTGTAVSRIAKMSGAVVLPYYCKRRADDSGYVMQIRPPLKNLPSDDEVEDMSRLMKELENFIRTCPEQYAWIHRRFKFRPEPLPDIYKKHRRSV